jgi:hypothetical protein
MLQEKLRGTQAAATCQYPVAMQGKSLTAMTETDFHCSECRGNIDVPVFIAFMQFIVFCRSAYCIYWCKFLLCYIFFLSRT